MNFTGPVRPVAYAPRLVHRQRCGCWPGQPAAPAPMTTSGLASGWPITLATGLRPGAGTAGHRARPSPISHSSLT